MIGIDPDFDFLYDPQQSRPAGWCPVCRREIYADGRELCGSCAEKAGGAHDGGGNAHAPGPPGFPGAAEL